MRRVHYLSIDAEKYDLPILHGLRASLGARAVDVVEFEYSRYVHTVPAQDGAWGNWTLRAALAELHGYGYGCWWQSSAKRHGCLYPASGACWRDGFECYFERELRASQLCVNAGNLVCAHGHAGALLAAFAAECGAASRNR